MPFTKIKYALKIIKFYLVETYFCNFLNYINFYLFSLCNKSKPKMNGDNYLKLKSAP